MMTEKITSKIIAYPQELKLPGVRNHFQDTLVAAAGAELGDDEQLLLLLEKEDELRLENRKKSRVRLAGFPYKKYLDDVDVPSLPQDARKKFHVFKSLDFIRSGQNSILAGNPGTGKTHLAVGLGINACMAGYTVFFTSVPTFIPQLKERRSQQSLRAFQNTFEKYDLVICDEFGSISCDKEGAELLFTNLSLRAGRKATIMTTTLSFDRWQELFGDPVLTAAMGDRLTYKAYIVNMTGNSDRLKETEEWIPSLSVHAAMPGRFVRLLRFTWGSCLVFCHADRRWEQAR